MQLGKPILKFHLMLRLNKIIGAFIVSIIPILAFGQDCTIKVHGRVIDEATGAGLPYATVYFENQSISLSADESGYFQFDGLCPDDTFD